jgi:hypothetical protein
MRYVLRKVEEQWAICVGSSCVVACDDLEEAFVLAWRAAEIMNAAALPSCCDTRNPEPPCSAG